jgi:hypothetical protein
VAVEPDVTLYPQYRRRFFLCRAEPGEVLRHLGCPKDSADSWLGLIHEQPPSDWRDFQAGPGSWFFVGGLCQRADQGRRPADAIWAQAKAAVAAGLQRAVVARCSHPRARLTLSSSPARGTTCTPRKAASTSG